MPLKGGMTVNMTKYDIAGIRIEVIADDNTYILDRFQSFFSRCSEKADLKVRVNSCDKLMEPKGKVLFHKSAKWLLKNTADQRIAVCIYGEESQELVAILEADPGWQNVSIDYLKTAPNIRYAAERLGNILMRNCILVRQGLVIHASAVEWQGKAVMFSAPSGTGKSTQAKLWRKHMGALILNDDCPAVRVAGGQARVYGTPWSGSSNIFLNSHAPLSAVIMLEQAPENRICRLTACEAVSRLMPRCYLPYYDRELMGRAINQLEKIIAMTPVFLLRCRPDREAVELVYECIK